MREKVPVSVMVLTKNDESRIVRCLDSVKWADEILVVDDESTDRTLEIVKKYTDRIFIKKMVIEGVHRNWAHSQCRNAWVLDIDSDEVVTPELKEEIEKVLEGNPKENGFTIPRRNYFGAYWLRHGGQYPAPQLKLFRKDKHRYEEVEVHGRVFMEDPCGHLTSDIIHYTYRDFEDALRKLNRQTTLEALKWYKNNKPMRLGRFIWRAVDRFMRSYLRKKGYKDGFIGFLMAFNASLYQIISYLKYRELTLKNKSTQ